ncbi:MAG: cob(I)yrinic acid a,c-diamide adenosyltransferase [Deltaproteobacteria bacterium]|nr:cob(I)yrinic acid a,c-diamide adenosyltransferase [Deltaproteobacteria bacterium]
MPGRDEPQPEQGAPDTQREPGFSAPRIAITRVYTRAGDAGQTSLIGGSRVSKHHPRVEACGAVEELNACIGLARQELRVLPAASLDLGELAGILLRVQHELFNLGSALAAPGAQAPPARPCVTERDVAALEADIDRYNAALAPLASFVLPGGCRAGATLQLARTVCRRAERAAVALAAGHEVEPALLAYLNRLGDALFVWGRAVVAALGEPETLWDPNRGSSGSGLG